MFWNISNQGESINSSYWAALGLLATALGAILKYLVWDFFNMPHTLHARYSTEIAEAQAAIHQKRFLPTLVGIFDSVEARKKLVLAASTTEILTELSIDARVREAGAALSVSTRLDRSYQTAIRLCPWTATPCLVVVLCSAALFFVHYHCPLQYRGYLTRPLSALILFSGLAATVMLGLFFKARNQLVRLLGENRL